VRARVWGVEGGVGCRTLPLSRSACPYSIVCVCVSVRTRVWGCVGLSVCVCVCV